MSKKSSSTVTPRVLDALKILREKVDEGVTPSQFARMFFPEDMKGWKRSSKCGTNGSATGLSMYQSAGSFLSRLHHMGLVYPVAGEHNTSWFINDKGIQTLKDRKL